MLLLVAGALGAPLRAETTAREEKPMTEIATLAGGCFWCIEAVYNQIPGVLRAESGYIGGHVENPTYDDICTGRTGHAEAVEVEFDPSKITFAEILDLFWQAHDPTQLNRQGNDIGTQYRSAIFYHSEAQKKAAEESMAKLRDSGKFKDPIVTELTAATTFYKAEGYHQDYYRNNRAQPYCMFVIRPKLKKMGLDP